tara:strand:+ start:254 stop:817 length:564 start_codon:yes stop_codon:yes gene_type:complete
MAYQKLVGQIQRSLTIIPDDNFDIPFPGNRKTPSIGLFNEGEGVFISDASGVAAELQCNTATFDAWGVEVGDIVYARANPITAHDPFVTKVESIVNSTTLTVKGLVGVDFASAGTPFEIYSPKTYPCQILHLYQGSTNTVFFLSQDGVQITSSNLRSLLRVADVPAKRIQATGTTNGSANTNFIGQW